MNFLQSRHENSVDVHSLLDQKSTLHADRVIFRPHMPEILKGLLAAEEGEATTCLTDPETCKQLFPHTYGQPKIRFVPHSGSNTLSPLIGRKIKIGVVFSGGPAPGGHNVLTGLFDFLKRRNNESELIGFLGGPGGVVSKKFSVIQSDELDHFRNIGGFHFLGSGRTKIETEEQLRASAQNCIDLDLMA